MARSDLDAVVIDVNTEKPSEENIPPVSFTQLFRFSTRLEIFLDFIGIIAALGAGAAQPLISLLFGRLAVSFVKFGILAQAIKSGNPTPDQIQQFHEAAADFKRDTAQQAGWLTLIGATAFFTTSFYMIIWTWTGEKNARRIRESYFMAVLRQEIAYFDKLGAGEVTTRIQTDTHLIQGGISEKVPLIVSFVGAFFTGYILAYARSWRLALAITSILPCIAITGAIMQKFLSGYTKTSLDHVAQGGSFAEEVISTIRTAKAFGTQFRLGAVYDSHVSKSYIADVKGGMVAGIGIGCFFFFIYASYGLAFSFGTTLMLQGHGDVGTIFNVFIAILIGSFSLALLAPEMQAVNTAIGAAAKIFATINRVPSIDSASPEGIKPSHVTGSITLDNVHFTYPSRPDVPVLKGISISFEPGTTSALVGASGCGKSTIVALIERFYDPVIFSHPTDDEKHGAPPNENSPSTSRASAVKSSTPGDESSAIKMPVLRETVQDAGSLKLDGVDLRELNVRWLRSQIGFVQQEPVLFATSIWKNVAYGLTGTPFEAADEAETKRLVKEACVKANADKFVSKLPDGTQEVADPMQGSADLSPLVWYINQGYETQVGERGFLLSGGQKQRIAIARAIVGDPAILLLDEATSALDTRSEGIVQHALNRASEGRTTITVAHRLSTIKKADCIFVIGDGAVVESGTHDDLLQNPNGAYARLVNAQALREQQEQEQFAAATASLTGDSATEEPENSKEEHAVTIPKAEATDPGIELTRRDTIGGKSALSEASQVARPPRDDKPQEYSSMHLIKRIAIINGESMWVYVLGAVAAIGNGGIYPLFALVYSLTIQGFQTTDRHQLRHNGDRDALWFFLIAIVAAFAMMVQSWAFQKAASTLTWKLRKLSFKSIVKQDVKWFDEEHHSTGALVSNLADSPQKIMGLAGVTLGAIIQSTATLVGGFIIGFAYGWKLSLVGLCTVPPLLTTGYIRLRVVVMKDESNKKSHEESAQIACEGASAIRTVASLKREDGFHQEYSASLESPSRKAIRSALIGSSLFGMTQSAVFFGTALIFWYGSRLVANLSYDTKQFYICLTGVTFGAIQAGNAFSFVPDVSSARGAATEIIRLVDSVPEIDADSAEGRTIVKAEGHLELRDVHFRYPTRPNVRVLRGINLTIPPGSYVAIVGASGCGKSTIVQLVERFYDPQAGQIFLDGQDITQLNVRDYRKQVALVSQEPTLYVGSIKFNIVLGSTRSPEEITQEDIDQACHDANIYDFITSLPDGFETQVGGKGSQLSGGQKQRIAIARALIRNPKVLLLDEATSALDSAAERVVQQAIDNAAKGRTTIAIAHRLSTIQNADQIYFVKDGQVAEAGTHNELLRLRGGYYELVQLQALSKK